MHYKNQPSATSDYNCIYGMLLRSSKNDKIEETRLSASAIVIAIQRGASCKTFRLTAPESLNTCPMFAGQSSIFTITQLFNLIDNGKPGLQFS